jgi:hypothetical protein
MSLDACCGFLDALALLNTGVNHSPDYSLVRLPPTATVRESVEAYFAQLSTSITPPQPASEWHIQLTSVPGDWTENVADASRRWFFGQPFSPRVNADAADDVVAGFVKLVKAVVGTARAHSLSVTPPMWYECSWEDIALESTHGFWLLHFGFSD